MDTAVQDAVAASKLNDAQRIGSKLLLVCRESGIGWLDEIAGLTAERFRRLHPVAQECEEFTHSLLVENDLGGFASRSINDRVAA